MTSPLTLWSDDPAAFDLLSFDAIADTVADALVDPALDPVALGLSGSWGSGKTTVLELIAEELQRRSTSQAKALVVRTDPWRYDPAVGAKESLISEILAALGAEIDDTQDTGGRARQLLGKLGSRIHWAKAIKLAATTSLTLQIPNIDQLLDLVKPADGDEGSVRGLDEFRNEFNQLITSKELAHLSTVAVLVDDLDRCLPETVVDTLEAIRLFLAVPTMSFVIAADEERVADAIRTRLRSTGRPEESTSIDRQDPASLYLHKIVQTTVALPALSHFDTQAYLLQLLIQATDNPNLPLLIDRCNEVRRTGGGLDDIGAIDGLAMDDELAFASRLTPLLYEKLRGNPRYIKRFLNDLRVRQAVAARRGIALEPAVIGKLMTLEALMKPEFELVLDWFAHGKLRDRMTRLEDAAGQPVNASAPTEPEPASKAVAGKGARRAERDDASDSDAGQFTQAMLRWAKLTPSLRNEDLSPYLTLAASFAGVTLIDDSLPEQLRDIAARLLSESAGQRGSVSTAVLAELGPGDAAELLRHIGRTMRDQPAKQKNAVNAIFQILRSQPGKLGAEVRNALLMLPPNDISVGTPLQFQSDDPAEVREVLDTWKQKLPEGPVRRAVDNALSTTGRR